MAPNTYLVLGGYTFTGFGVPETINGGGAHQLVVHKLLGGARIIDALGPDDDVIAWRGRFRGADAMSDALLMDVMRRSGRPVLLTYWNQSIMVVVSRFRWDFNRFYEVPYQLECMVVSNQAAQGTSSPPTLDGAVGSDVSLAQTLSAGSSVTATQVAAVSQTYSINGPLATASSADVTTMENAISAANANLAGTASAADIPAGAPAGLSGAGGDPAVRAAALSSQAATMSDGAAAQNVMPVLSRMSTNVGTLN